MKHNLLAKMVFGISVVIIISSLYVIYTGRQTKNTGVPPVVSTESISEAPSPNSKISAEQAYCETVADCGLVTCGCTAMNKRFINEKDGTCTMMCQGEPQCVNNTCILQ